MTANLPQHMAQRIELWAIDMLKPYDRNPRTHDESQLAKLANSIREFGFTNPILVDGMLGIIAGHGRLEAAKRIGLTEVPVIVLDYLTHEQKQAYIIADNRLALDAGWDEELLAGELQALDDAGFDLSLTGFDDSELERLLEIDDDSGLLPDADPDDVAEPQADPVSVLGDLWLLGRHRLLCGDSTSIDAVDRLMDGGKALLIVTDPPYNIAYEGGTKDKLTILNDEMDSGSFYQFLLDAYTAMYHAADDGCAIYVFHSEFEGVSFRKALVDAGFKLSQCCMWVKHSLVLSRQDYHWQHEPVLYGVKHDPILYGWKPTGGHRWFGDRKQTTVWNFDRPSKNADHPTMKPIDLIEYPILNSSQPGEIVLDLFGGSGSTLIACERTKRVARLMELDPRYVDVIVRRWQDLTGKKARLESDGRTFAEVEAQRQPTAQPSPAPAADIAPVGLLVAGMAMTHQPAANDSNGAQGAAA